MRGNLEKLLSTGIVHPVMQAGMPGVATMELAAAVSRAGGIGTLGLQDVSTWQQSLRQAKTMALGKPINVNLLLPYTRRKHVEDVIRERIPLVTLFWGKAEKLTKEFHRHSIFVFQQVGSVEEAARALEAGIDAIIVQGAEAGGHIRGKERLADLLPRVTELAFATPVFAAGGMYSSADVRRAVALGACGVSTGTRFVLTVESNAHDAYKTRLLHADETVVTGLFGLGWTAPHRVLRNVATDRWCGADGGIPRWLRIMNAAFSWTRKLVPFKSEFAIRQRPYLPLFTIAAPLKQLPGSMERSAALYAGEEVVRLRNILSAEAVVQELARGLLPFSQAERP